MWIRDLDGNRIKWKIQGVDINEIRPRSSLHLIARDILVLKFPTAHILEEVSIPIRKWETLFLDFYLPLRNMAIEVHGEQHYKYNTMFHKTRFDFIKQKQNDTQKREWCEINNIEYIVWSYEQVKNWGKTINE